MIRTSSSYCIDVLTRIVRNVIMSLQLLMVLLYVLNAFQTINSTMTSHVL